MKRQINIIPTDASEDYRKALGYCWQDYENKIPGEDRRGEFKVYQQTVLELESQGIICVDAKTCGRLPEGAVVVARIDCMWCGGAETIGYTLPAIENGEKKGESLSATVENPGEESVETALIVAVQERAREMELDAEYGKHTGWCKKCHSFCYGDCEAN